MHARHTWPVSAPADLDTAEAHRSFYLTAAHPVKSYVEQSDSYCIIRPHLRPCCYFRNSSSYDRVRRSNQYDTVRIYELEVWSRGTSAGDRPVLRSRATNLCRVDSAYLDPQGALRDRS